MNLDKSEIKIALAQDWGKRIEQMQDEAKAESLRLEGAKGALKQAVKSFDSVRQFYQEQIDAETLSADTAKEIMQAINRCSGVCVSLQDYSEAGKNAKLAQSAAFDLVIGMFEKDFNAERVKLQSIATSIESGEIQPDSGGNVRPINPAAVDLAARRAVARARYALQEQFETEKPKRRNRKKSASAAGG